MIVSSTTNFVFSLRKISVSKRLPCGTPARLLSNRNAALGSDTALKYGKSKYKIGLSKVLSFDIFFYFCKML